MRVDIIILAAGQGHRMKSSLPKVLHAIAGKPMLEHVIISAKKIQQTSSENQIHVVVGCEEKQVKEALGRYDVNWVVQEEQLGTGHAVRQALPGCIGADVVLVLYGDVPLISPLSLQSLLAASNSEQLGLLTINLASPSGYGRIVRCSSGGIQSVVEDKDATPEQLSISEINTGIMAIPGNRLDRWINKLKNDNAQQEFYLTDVVSMSAAEAMPVVHVQPVDAIEVKGVNSRIQLAELERALQEKLAVNLMNNGVTIIDPKRLDIRGDVSVGSDITLDVNVVLEGDVELADKVTIGPGCVICNSIIGEGAVIKAYSILENAVVSAYCEVGPYARLRPETRLAEKVKVGNFVEIKKSSIGVGSKVSHLSYIGDSEVGDDVNIGAGTITCNYDGVNKSKTIIGDGAFVGSNSSLVAPVEIGRLSTIGAGSTITKKVPSEQLAIGRGQQRNIKSWSRPIKKD